MRIRWIGEARFDLVRFHEFLAPVNRQAAARTVRGLQAAPARLLRDNPRLGRRLPGFVTREVRRLFVSDYEIRGDMSSSCLADAAWKTVDGRCPGVPTVCETMTTETERLAMAQ